MTKTEQVSPNYDSVIMSTVIDKHPEMFMMGCSHFYIAYNPSYVSQVFLSSKSQAIRLNIMHLYATVGMCK